VDLPGMDIQADLVVGNKTAKAFGDLFELKNRGVGAVHGGLFQVLGVKF
jgi:hypothetical protein